MSGQNGSLSQASLDTVLSALTEDVGLTPAQVYRRQSGLAHVTVRHALRELCQAGKATFDGEDCSRLYRRVAGTPS